MNIGLSEILTLVIFFATVMVILRLVRNLKAR